MACDKDLSKQLYRLFVLITECSLSFCSGTSITEVLFLRHVSVTTDINKFLWMVRIGGSTDTGRHIKEHDYYTPTGEFRVDREGSPVLLNCLMYKMCYYRFGQVYTEASEYFCHHEFILQSSGPQNLDHVELWFFKANFKSV